jgi:hypothetical protein
VVNPLTANAHVDVRLLRKTDDLEDFATTVCSPKYTPRVYGDTPRSTADRFLDQHFNPRPDTHASTTKSEVWVAFEKEDILGYYVHIFKRWGTVKGSTFIVKNEHQGRGIGRRMHQVIESDYDQRAGIRKLFHTLPVPETGHIRLSVGEFGYQIEGHMRTHYVPGSDELIVGRRPARWAPAQAQPTLFPHRLAEGGPVRVEELSGKASAAEADAMLPWLRATHDPVDRAHCEWLLTPSPKRHVFVARGKEGPAGFLVLSKKHVKLDKAMLVLDPAAPSREAATALAKTALRVSAEDNVRKVFTEVPDPAIELRHLLAGLGFRREGVPSAPYKEGVDLVVMSHFLPGGSA